MLSSVRRSAGFTKGCALLFVGLQEPVVRKVDSAINRTGIFSTVVKMLEKPSNHSYRIHNNFKQVYTSK